ncbi:spore coat assembly protein SafA/uncharacterized YkwD family protein [Alkalibaculum bacchi]|uniref:Spore coat assembly protein SafA/uncharacterized YkwD family protein n=1 Tax=Alkalibaculum bacchi TaxID=645887 RepID=A0A366IHU0_9FIRM|nr:SafA/ExsA family spore coat assembly protein [Alkalibaculum bacchi]RBP70229.1 spore coat assembly protein SafA/uncharacterized YkwD family protein [Alkalibaculum bacchi]
MKKIIFTLLFVLLFMPVVGAQPTGDYDTYMTQSGDTLWIISLKYGVNLSEVIAANPQLEDPDMIYPGDKINVPLYEKKYEKKEGQSVEKQVIELTNQERAKNGLAPLAYNGELCNVARAKSQDMIDNNYFDHNSPTYGSPFDMMKSFNIDYSAAGENIAKGQRSAQEVVTGWMNSEGHRKNILNSNYNQIGVGCVNDSNGTLYWTQMLIRQ